MHLGLISDAQEYTEKMLSTLQQVFPPDDLAMVFAPLVSSPAGAHPATQTPHPTPPV